MGALHPLEAGWGVVCGCCCEKLSFSGAQRCNTVNACCHSQMLKEALFFQNLTIATCVDCVAALGAWHGCEAGTGMLACVHIPQSVLLQRYARVRYWSSAVPPPPTNHWSTAHPPPPPPHWASAPAGPHPGEWGIKADSERRRRAQAGWGVV
jgi:hypothetical protein